MADHGFIDTGEFAVRYQLREGSAPAATPLVLLHEMGGSLHSWDRVLPLIDQGRAVLRYDARGAGQSEKWRGTGCTDRLLRDLQALLDALGIDRPVVLAGCALAGAIALLAAASFPERVAGVVAMSPVTDVLAERKAGLLRHADRMESEGLRSMVDDSLRVSYPPALIDDDAVFRAFRARWLANDPHSFAAYYRLLAGLDITARLADVQCPTLVIAALQDALRPADKSRELARSLPRATCVELDTGHFMPTQTPALVAGVLNGFMATLDDPALHRPRNAPA